MEMLSPDAISRLFYSKGQPVTIGAKSSNDGTYVGRAVRAISAIGEGTLIWIHGIVPEHLDVNREGEGRR